MRLFFLILSITILALNSLAQKSTKLNKMEETPVQLSEAAWKEKLTPAQYFILREKGTEKPFSGEFNLHKEAGIYKCAGCGAELFTSEMKFDAHCGWPSFDREIAGGKIKTAIDKSGGRTRTEIMCAKCGGHLGHVFEDGPTETGLRYCVNSVSLSFEPVKK